MTDAVSREVAQLLRQREQYRLFLERLEERAADAHPRAYERVKADYEGKLRAITEKLATHVDALRQAIEETKTAVTDLEVRRDAKREELEEAKLRREVGEFADEKEWRAVERRLQRELQELEASLDAQRTLALNLAEVLEQVEAEVAGGAGRSAAPAAAAPSATGTDPGAKPVRRVREPGRLTEDTPEPEGEPAPERRPRPAAERPARPAAREEVEELRFLESLSLDAEALPDEEAESEVPEPAAPPADAPLAFLGQSGTGRPETVICPRCSAANDPAEWYCVECGEELPAG
jgi:hypothetical protein